MSAQCWWLVPFGSLALLVGCRGVTESVRPAGQLGGGVAPESWAVTPAWRVAPDDEPPLLQPVRHERRSARAKPRRRAVPLSAPVCLEPGPVSPAPVQLRMPEVPAGLAHASDYGWLVGRLFQPAGSDRWWVQYADASADPRYAGALELVGAGTMDQFQPGDLVRVEGELVDPAPLEVRPAYHPRSIQAAP